MDASYDKHPAALAARFGRKVSSPVLNEVESPTPPPPPHESLERGLGGFVQLLADAGGGWESAMYEGMMAEFVRLRSVVTSPCHPLRLTDEE